jgi:hypothetical protein
MIDSELSNWLWLGGEQKGDPQVIGLLKAYTGKDDTKGQVSRAILSPPFFLVIVVTPFGLTERCASCHLAWIMLTRPHCNALN